MLRIARNRRNESTSPKSSTGIRRPDKDLPAHRNNLGIGPRGLRVDDQRDEARDLAVRLYRVPQRQLAMHLVSVAATDPLALEVVARLEVGHDALHGPLGDANSASDITQPDLGFPGDQEQHVRVVAQECPCCAVTGWRLGGSPRRSRRS